MTAFGRPRRRRYRDSVSARQQVRSFSGKRSAIAMRQLVRRGVGGGNGGASKHSASFFAALASRLDRTLFRRRRRPTVVAVHQFIHHQGVAVNGKLVFSPRAVLQPGDTVSFLPDVISQKNVQNRRRRWRTVLWDLFCRTYYRRWGLFTLRRRLLSIAKKRGRRSAIRRGSVIRTDRFRNQISKIAGLGNVNSSLLSAKQSAILNKAPQARLLFRIRLALRLRKALLPRRRSFTNRRQTASPRMRRRRLLLTRRSKLERQQKVLRLRPVHFIRPTHIHVDFRTLRAVRIRYPTPEESVFPFRVVRTQIANFFRTRGM